MAKILPILIVVVLCGVARAQEFVAPKTETREIEETTVVTPTRPTIEGIVKEIFVDKKPWQLVNPVAPASYGTGEKMVSKDFGPATPYHSSGWVVMGFEW